MRVLFATSELYPLVKTGGLADVSQALPAALAGLGTQVTVILPGYASVLKQLGTPLAEYRIDDAFTYHDLSVLEYNAPDNGFPLLVVKSDSLYNRDGGPYQDAHGQDWPDNPQRFAQFARAVTAMLDPRANSSALQFDVVHCNDWQTGLVPAFVRLNYLPVASVFTIHNLAYQGAYDYRTFESLTMPPRWWHMDKLEFYGRFSFLKGGIVFADQVTTVSPSYAEEILHEPMGCGMAGLLQHYQSKLQGILNGVNYEVWDPAGDPHLARQYTVDQLPLKAENKLALQRQFGLAVDRDVPLFGVIGRLAHQKGIDYLLDALVPLPPAAQWVILGSGDRELEQRLRQLARENPTRIAFVTGYDESLSHRIEAGADVFVMPSRYEPCGLNQLYSLRYGTLPLVHATGGLKDTVTHETTGFVYSGASAPALRRTIDHAIDRFRDRDAWRTMQKTAMKQCFDWQRSAQGYITLYEAHAIR